MPADAARLFALAEAIADGTPPAWAEAEARLPGAEDRALVRELRLLAGLADAHRSLGGDEPTTSSTPDGPSRWGVLEIRERLGGGTFGTVHRAWDPRLARDVALKLLHTRPSRGEPVSSIVEEGRLLARVRHPHVVTVYGADHIDGRVGIWMEFIRGRTLEAVLRQQGPFSAREAASIGAELCGALAAVHHERMVHRDVKAQNVMREDGGRLVLMDFGAGQEMARDGLAGPIVGTPVYMAPEVLDGADATPSADLFSLGVLLFHIVTGEYPVDGRTAYHIRAAHARGESRRLADLRPDLPAAFVQAVERALSPDPADRFETAGAMQAALAQVFEPEIAARRVAPWNRWQWAGAAAVVLAIAAAGYGLWPGAFGGPPAKNVVVLPLTNLSGNPADAYFADGVTEILMSRLAMVRPLRVIARTSVAAVPGDQRDPASLRRSLSADYAVEGSVQRTENRVRVSARILEASTGSLLWAETFERPLADLFTLQGEIASAIATRIGARLTGEVRGRLEARETTSAAAQDAYLQGRYLLYTFNSANMRQARELFEQAVVRDPGYAIAHASLSRTYGMMLDFDLASPAELEPLAIEAAARAVKSNPNLVETNVAQADAQYRFQRDWDAADKSYRRALALAPYSSLALSPYSRYLSAAGRLDEALDRAELGAQSDPLSAEMLATVGVTLYYRREYDEALRWYRRASELSPSYGPAYFGMARAYSGKGEYDKAIESIRKAQALVGENASYQAELARTYALHGWTELAEQTLGGLLVRAREGRNVPYEGIGYTYAALGRPDQAFEWLNRSLEHYFARMLFLKVDPRADPIRNDPRYAALLRRLGLQP